MDKENILYICTQCKYEENIPKEVVEYFDEIDQSNIDESTQSFAFAMLKHFLKLLS